jgi:protein-tyrosine phosphatase
VTEHLDTRPHRILTVCKGNHCRAPLAAAVLRRRGRTDVEVRSAGIRDWHVGKPAHPIMIEIAAHHGYDLTDHRGAQITPELLNWADTVLAMDNAVLETLTEFAATSDTGPRLRLYLDSRDVPDPWNQPPTAFTDCLHVIEQGAARHLDRP